MKFDEKHLAQLAAVVEAGGVTEGANLIGLSQPAVSRTLSAMEKRLGEPLFLPGRRPLVPSVIGKELAAYGKIILEASRQASQAAQGFRAGSFGTVRLGGVPFFMDAMISRMIGSFQMVQPDIRIDQTYGYLTDLQAGLTSGQLDMVICPMGGGPPGPSLDFVEMLPGHNVVAASAGHPLLNKKMLRANDLLSYPWVSPLPGSPLLADLRSILLSLGMSDVKVRYTGGSLWSVLNYLEETHALTVLPYSVVFAARNSHNLRAIPVRIPQPARTLGILRQANAPRLPAADKLADFLIASMEDLRRVIQRHQSAIPWSM